jgi:hypothetical protein
MPKYVFNKEDKYNIERIMAATFISEKIGYTYKLNELILKKKGYIMYFFSYLEIPIIIQII